MPFPKAPESGQTGGHSYARNRGFCGLTTTKMQKRIVTQYQRLLAGEETLENLREALHLLESTPFVRTHSAALEAVKNGKNGESQSTHSLLELTTQTTRTLSTIPPSLNDAAQRRVVSPEDYSFLMDLCFLVFHQACFVLLPQLSLANRNRQREALLASFQSLAESLPRAADRFAVSSRIAEACGNMELAARYYREWVAATHSDDHEFMSVLQSAWLFHLEQREYRLALDLLLQASPRVARTDLDEVRELILLTFDRQQGDSGEPPARRRRTGTR